MNKSLFDFTGKRVLVTGGSRGLGLEIAKAFSVAGADVVISGRNADALNKVQRALKGQALMVQVVAADLIDEAGGAGLQVRRAPGRTGYSHSCRWDTRPTRYLGYEPCRFFGRCRCESGGCLSSGACSAAAASTFPVGPTDFCDIDRGVNRPSPRPRVHSIKRRLVSARPVPCSRIRRRKPNRQFYCARLVRNRPQSASCR